MRERIAELLEADVERVNVKATTTERWGSPAGRRASLPLAVVCLVKEG